MPMTQRPIVDISELMAQSGVAFGTSGARGPVVAMTDAVCFAYTAAFLQHMASVGEFEPGSHVALAGDLRPSTPRILAACAAAVQTQQPYLKPSTQLDRYTRLIDPFN
jgi:phosphomannomutase